MEETEEGREEDEKVDLGKGGKAKNGLSCLTETST
jgi:hypothetical protein